MQYLRQALVDEMPNFHTEALKAMQKTYDQATDALTIADADYQRDMDALQTLETKETMNPEPVISCEVAVLMDRLEEIETCSAAKLSEMRDFLGSLERAEKRRRVGF